MIVFIPVTDLVIVMQINYYYYYYYYYRLVMQLEIMLYLLPVIHKCYFNLFPAELSDVLFMTV